MKKPVCNMQLTDLDKQEILYRICEEGSTYRHQLYCQNSVYYIETMPDLIIDSNTKRPHKYIRVGDVENRPLTQWEWNLKKLTTAGSFNQHVESMLIWLSKALDEEFFRLLKHDLGRGIETTILGKYLKEISKPPTNQIPVSIVRDGLLAKLQTYSEQENTEQEEAPSKETADVPSSDTPPNDTTPISVTGDIPKEILEKLEGLKKTSK